MNDSVLLSEAKRQLLQKLLAGSDIKRGKTVPPVVARPTGTVAPISAEQVNVWVHASMAPDQPLYNESITIHRRGTLDVAVLEQAFNEILRRHEIWRTAFANRDGEIVQLVAPDVRVALPLTDLGALPPNEREAEALRLATDDSRRPIDLAAAPLFRVRLVKIAEDEHRLYLTLHRIIFDGVSIYRILVPELAALYAAFAAGRAPDLPEPQLQYGDYAYWRRQRIASGALDGQLDYWRERLAGELPVLQLPTDRPRRQDFSYRGSMETFALSRALSEQLKELSRKEGVTLYMTLLAAFKVLLHRYSGQDDLIVGGVTDTRRRPELQSLMGYFLNSLALRSRPRASMPFRAYLQEVRDAVLGALTAGDIPFDRVVREVKPKRDASRHPLFQVLFSIEPPAPQFSDGWDLTQMDVSIGASKFDLYLGGWCTAGILAYEVARQLMEQGCEVGLLVLVHATNPVHYKCIGESRLRASKIRHHLTNVARLKGAARWRYAADRLCSVKDATIDRFRVPQAVEQTRSLARVLDHAALCYETPPYAGDVALFQPADRPDVLDYRPGWRAVVRGAFAAFEIAGGHRTMLEAPYVAELAARMNVCLRRAQLRSRPVAAPRRAAG